MNKTFTEWFNSDYLMQMSTSSALLIGNKSISEKQSRICEIGEMMISRDTESIEVIKRDIAFKYFVTLRCATDYVKLTEIFIEKYFSVYPKKNHKV
jgi:hypothetical protein